MPTLFMTIGLPASGKTMWAKQYQATHGVGKVTRVNKDDLRAMLDDGKWSKDNEKFVLTVRDSIIYEALESGRHVIVDDTNLDPKHEKALRGITKTMQDRGYNVTFEVVPFTRLDGKSVEETYEICLERNAKRCGSAKVPDKVIKEMYQKYLAPKVPKVTYDPNLPDCIIVDLDGTLCLRGERGPYEWARVGEDKRNELICELVQQFLSEHDDQVIFVSGRDEVCRDETDGWLKANFDHVEGSPLFMRSKADMRDDRIIKKEIYEREIVGKYNVRFILDDRDKVVKMWRSLGLTCLQVAEGNF